MRGLFFRLRRASPDLSETVWLPVVVAVAVENGAGSPRKPGVGAERPLFVVERVLGHGWAISCDPAQVSADESDGIDGGRAPRGGEAVELPARLAVEDCRRSVMALAARASFALTRGRSPGGIELEPLRAGCYPFRLSYRRRRSRRIDFEAVDAVTGRRAGSSLRAAIAAALIDADRSRAES